MANKASTELEGHGDAQGLRVVRRLSSTPGHERFVARGKDDDRDLIVERFTSTDPEPLAVLTERAHWLTPIASPHLVRIESVRESLGALTVVQPHVAGKWLDDLVRAEEKHGSKFLALAVQLRIVLDVLTALSALHLQKSVTPAVHGAVSSRTVLVGLDGHARLTGALRGTKTAIGYAYAAPEILLGDGTADHRADLYSACVLLWEALSGKRLFVEQDAQKILTRQLSGPLPRAVVREPWAEPLADVAAKGLSVAPDDRYEAASEIASAIRMVAQARLAAATRVGRMVESLGDDKLVLRKDGDSSLAPPKPSAAPNAKPRHQSGLHRIDAVPTPIIAPPPEIASLVAAPPPLPPKAKAKPTPRPVAPEMLPTPIAPMAPIDLHQIAPQATAVAGASEAAEEAIVVVPIESAPPPPIVVAAPVPLTPAVVPVETIVVPEPTASVEKRRRMLIPIVVGLITLVCACVWAVISMTRAPIAPAEASKVDKPAAVVDKREPLPVAPLAADPARGANPTETSKTIEPAKVIEPRAAAPSGGTTQAPAVEAPAPTPTPVERTKPRRPKGRYEPEGI